MAHKEGTRTSLPYVAGPHSLHAVVRVICIHPTCKCAPAAHACTQARGGAGQSWLVRGADAGGLLRLVGGHWGSRSFVETASTEELQDVNNVELVRLEQNLAVFCVCACMHAFVSWGWEEREECVCMHDTL